MTTSSISVEIVISKTTEDGWNIARDSWNMSELDLVSRAQTFTSLILFCVLIATRFADGDEYLVYTNKRMP